MDREGTRRPGWLVQDWTGALSMLTSYSGSERLDATSRSSLLAIQWTATLLLSTGQISCPSAHFVSSTPRRNAHAARYAMVGYTSFEASASVDSAATAARNTTNRASHDKHRQPSRLFSHGQNGTDSTSQQHRFVSRITQIVRASQRPRSEAESRFSVVLMKFHLTPN